MSEKKNGLNVPRQFLVTGLEARAWDRSPSNSSTIFYSAFLYSSAAVSFE